MKISEYIPLAVRTEKPLPTSGRLTHGCMGLVTEIGEVVTELKRMAIYGKPLDAERKAHILEEVGDVMWYIAIILDTAFTDVDFLDDMPKIVPPDQDEFKWEATALMLGSYCGKLCTIVEYFIIDGEIDKETVPAFVESIGLLITGMTVLAEACDSTLEQTMEANIAKLRIRFPDAYSNEAAEGRADKAGADARVS